jgi:hypothetical protein
MVHGGKLPVSDGLRWLAAILRAIGKKVVA